MVVFEIEQEQNKEMVVFEMVMFDEMVVVEIVVLDAIS